MLAGLLWTLSCYFACSDSPILISSQQCSTFCYVLFLKVVKRIQSKFCCYKDTMQWCEGLLRMISPHVLGGGILHTCVLRPPGIYGPEEQRHLPRLAVCHLNFLTSRVFCDMGTKLKGASLICVINWLILLGSNSAIQSSAEDILTFLASIISVKCRCKKQFFF